MSAMRRVLRCEVAGGIASGKSTLVLALASEGIASMAENFSANPFFEDFYLNPARYAFETEITYMLQHYSSIADAAVSEQEIVASDFSMVLDLAYARVTLGSGDLDVFEHVFDHALTKIGCPDLLIKLDCPPKVELARIRERARPAERGIAFDYLSKLNESIERVLIDRRFEGLNILRIDSDKQDFRSEGKGRDAVVARVLAAINP